MVRKSEILHTKIRENKIKYGKEEEKILKRKRGKNRLLTGKINRKKGNMKKNEIHPYEQRAARQYNMSIISLNGSF